MVFILGGWQSDFARNWAREGLEIYEAFSETLQAGLAAARIDARDVASGHVGNFVGDLFNGQGHLNGFFAMADDALDGLPSARHEAACASGSVAVLAATAEIEAGRYDLACVLGIEQMRNVPGRKAAEFLGAAAWKGHEFTDAGFVWPRAFSDLIDEYERRYGMDPAHLRRISEINFANARHNPNAQTRSYAFGEKSFTDDDDANPVIEGRTRKMDCGQVSDGACVVFLASDEYASRYLNNRGLRPQAISRLAGWGHRTSPISLGAKLDRSRSDTHVFPQVRNAINDARRRAGVTDVTQIHALETHDCFAMTEYMAIDHFGLSAPGESWKAIESGVIEMGGSCPVNPSGGLIGLGHPVGATGVRMLLDAHKQVTGTAGDYQVGGAERVQTLNIGGSATTNVSLVVERAA